MIRTVIGFFVAAVAICAFIVIGSFGKQNDPAETAIEVTRAEVDPVSELLTPNVVPERTPTIAKVPDRANTNSRVLESIRQVAPAPANNLTIDRILFLYFVRWPSKNNMRLLR